jgi:HK97 family phage portal protein
MGLVSHLKSQSGGGPGPNPRDTFWLREPFFAARTDSGEVVSVEQALGLDAVWAAVRARAWGVGQLELRSYRRVGLYDREPADNAPIARVLFEPNREQSDMDCYSLISTHLNTWGNSYVGKTFELLRPTVVRELWPWHPMFVRVARKNGEKLFYLTDPETGEEDQTPYTRSEFIHVMGFSLDGLTGLSPISMAREGLGEMRARQRFAQRLWKNNAIPPLVLQTDGEIGAVGRRQLERDWNRKYRGVKNAGRVAVLEQGLKAQPLSLPLGDAQFVEQEQASVQRIARWFSLSPSRIGGSSGDSMTYKNVDSEFLRHLVFDLQPELVLIEKAFAQDRDCFPRRPGDARPEIFPAFDTHAFLRSDIKTQAETDAIANGGRAWELPSEQRRRRNMTPAPELDDPERNPSRGAPASVPSSADGGSR